jgi:agmatine deiminase
VEQVLWIDEGIVGDDTDGHIDDTVRFVNSDTLLTVIEENKDDENFSLLQNNLNQLQGLRLLNDKQLNIVELPMPDPVIWDGQRLPASYANFYIANGGVLVPQFNDPKDKKAIETLQNVFPNHKVIGIFAREILLGGGNIHCITQQQPSVSKK